MSDSLSQVASISADAIAAAAERRTHSTPVQKTAAQQAREHERRQKFRRMIDPGIVRPNPDNQALRSLKTLLTISENLLREPGNPKFQQFKPTNSVIKRDLVEPKGTLEYAIEMGFRPEVQDFQPYYTFNKHRIEELEIGAAILKEYLDVVNEKQARLERSRASEKAAKEAEMERVKLAFMDDRKTKSMRDDLEKEQRAGRQAAAARRAAEEASNEVQPPAPPSRSMPGSGHVLGLTLDDADGDLDSDSVTTHDKTE